jgi:hypothetical protein
MSTQLQIRRGTAAAWTSADPILAEGEPGLETDTNKLKFGDGTSAWTTLPYFPTPVAAPLAINPQTGVAYTLALADAFGMVEMSNAGANTLTVPLNATIAFPVGTLIYVAQGAAGLTTIAPFSGAVTIKHRSATLNLGGQEAVAQLIKVDVDVWRAFGDLA